MFSTPVWRTLWSPQKWRTYHLSYVCFFFFSFFLSVFLSSKYFFPTVPTQFSGSSSKELNNCVPPLHSCLTVLGEQCLLTSTVLVDNFVPSQLTMFSFHVCDLCHHVFSCLFKLKSLLLEKWVFCRFLNNIQYSQILNISVV